MHGSEGKRILYKKEYWWKPCTCVRVLNKNEGKKIHKENVDESQKWHLPVYVWRHAKTSVIPSLNEPLASQKVPWILSRKGYMLPTKVDIMKIPLKN